MGRTTRHNKLTTPEDIAKISDDNKRLIEDFLIYLKSTKKSDGTIFQYKSDLNIFFVWNMKNNKNKDFVKLSKRDIISFQNWLINTNGNSSARVSRMKSVLSSLSNYIENILDEEYEDFKPIIRKIENPEKQVARTKTVLSTEQVENTLKQLVDNKEYLKACTLALAAYSGRRKQELPRFKVNYFEDKNLICGGSLYETPEPILTKGRGGGKWLICYTLAHKFKPYLDLWLNYRNENNINSEWLLPNPNNWNEPMSISTLNSYAETFSKMMGVNFYFHSMRHHFTTYLSKCNIPNTVITKIVGWESTQMCDVYIDTTTSEMLDEYFNADGIAPHSKASLSDL